MFLIKLPAVIGAEYPSKVIPNLIGEFESWPFSILLGRFFITNSALALPTSLGKLYKSLGNKYGNPGACKIFRSAIFYRAFLTASCSPVESFFIAPILTILI